MTKGSGPVRFYFTMNMQSRSGNPTHQVIGGVDGISSVDAMRDLMHENEFIVIEEFYKNPDGSYYSRGQTILNTLHIGKVKIEA